jgi:RNA recognition motif-containing protein
MNIFVAKLSPRMTDETLESLFSKFGKVDSAKVIMDKETGRSKCYGFVEMPDENEGNEAIAQLNEVEVDESTIVVKQARPREERGSGGGGNRRQGGFGGGGQRRDFKKRTY